MPGSLYGQDIEEGNLPRNTVESIFTELDLTRVPTGLLQDYATDLIALDGFNGSLTNNNYVVMPSLEYIMRTVRTSSVSSTKPFSQVSTIIENMKDNLSETVIPVCVVAYKYNYILPNAVSAGKLQLVNNKPKDVFDNGVWKNPYGERKVVAFSPFVNIVPRNTNLNYKFTGSFFTNLNISTIQFDAGDGLGYRGISPSSQVSVSYSSLGDKDLKLKLTLTNGSIVYSHSHVYVCNPNELMTKGSDEILTSYPYDYSRSFVQGEAKAYITVKYANTNTTGGIKKPLIIVEGFDPVDLCTDQYYDDYYDDKGFFNLCSLYDNGYGASRLASDYDTIFVDWDNSELPIETNALLLKDIITWVNNQNTISSESVLWAMSMGGLIAREALVSMEKSGTLHHVRTFISHDVPYLGVNVPPGLLYIGNDLLHHVWLGALPLSGIASLTSLGGAAIKYLNGVSAQQMLINYITPSFSINHSQYNNLRTKLSQDGFPSLSYNIAISNGGWNSISSGSFLSLDASITTNPEIIVARKRNNSLNQLESFLLYLLQQVFHVSSLQIVARTYPFTAASSPASYLKIYKNKYYPWNPSYSQEIKLHERSKNNPSGLFPLDLAYGSYYQINFYGQDSVSTSAGSYSYDLHYSNSRRFLFVPTTSSLCVGKGLRSLSSTDYTATSFNVADTPFANFLIVPNYLNLHIDSDSTIFDWIYDYQYRYISGPDCPTTNNRTYVLDNWNSSVSWSTSDSNVATINSNGRLTKVSNDLVSVIATITDASSSTITYQKKVLTGIPPFSLTKSCPTGTNHYTVTAQSPTPLSEIPAGAALQYLWGFKDDGSTSIQWQSGSSQPSISFFLTNHGRRVYFKAQNSYYTGTTYNIYCKLMPEPGNPILSPFIVNEEGEFFVDDELDESKDEGVEQGEYSVSYCLSNRVSATLDHIPDSKELLALFLKDDSFVDELHLMKPWGEEPFVIIPVQVMATNGKDEVRKELPMKFIYMENKDICDE